MAWCLAASTMRPRRRWHPQRSSGHRRRHHTSEISSIWMATRHLQRPMAAAARLHLGCRSTAHASVKVSALSAEHAGAVLSIWAANAVPLAALWNVAAIAGTCSRATRRSLCSTREPPLAAATARSRCGDAIRWHAGRFKLAPGVLWSTAPCAATAACAHGC